MFQCECYVKRLFILCIVKCQFICRFYSRIKNKILGVHYYDGIRYMTNDSYCIWKNERMGYVGGLKTIKFAINKAFRV